VRSSATYRRTRTNSARNWSLATYSPSRKGSPFSRKEPSAFNQYNRLSTLRVSTSGTILFQNCSSPSGFVAGRQCRPPRAPEERLRELEPVHAFIRRWCGQEAVEEFDQVLALQGEVDRLRNLVQETAWWLKHNGHPVKAGLLRKELGRILKANEKWREHEDRQ
jgi:hypothetical protein